MTQHSITGFQVSWDHQIRMGAVILELENGESQDLAFRMTEFAAVGAVLQFDDLYYDDDKGIIGTRLITR